MRINKVKSNYDRLNDHELSTRADGVVLGLTGNTFFPDAVPTAADFKVLADDFKDKLAIASPRGSSLEISMKDEARIVLLKAMRRLANCVNDVADGNAPMLFSSGFDMGAQPKDLPSPGKVTGVKVTDGRQSGQMRLDFDSLKEAYQYEYQISYQLDENGDPIWGESFFTGSSRANTIAPVIPDERYYVRVRARNTKGIGDWSDIVSLRAR
ncbi:hypothetical protein SAMN05216436_101252 [bacterium A37T11]|nr:hypothetical protein SAMN05216436_101252 [bacterium A37T11]